MLAPRQIPEDFKRWNRRWSAPHGRVARLPAFLRHTRFGTRRRGPFAWQPNNSIRAFEFPWAYDVVTRHGRGLNVVEIGGGLSGLQFVLARDGHAVTNVDPGQPELGWAISGALHRRLRQVFSAPVSLLETTIEHAGIPDATADVLLCISALEHFPEEALDQFARHAPRILKRDGIAVLTTDLFLNVSPFTGAASNEFGRNIDIEKLLARSGLELVAGNRRELFGFPEFRADEVRASLDRYLVGSYPAMAQCLVAKRATRRTDAR